MNRFSLLVMTVLLVACASVATGLGGRTPVFPMPENDTGAVPQVRPMTPRSPDPPGLSGRFRSCDADSNCALVELHADGTMLYTPRVPGVKYPPLSGYYQNMGGGLLAATTIEQSPPPRVSASSERDGSGTVVTVADAVGGIALLDAGVSLDCKGMSAYVPTNGLGRSSFGACLPVFRIVVTKAGYETASIEVTDPAANSFTVWLHQSGPYLNGQLWFLAGDKLLFLSAPPLLATE